MQEVHSYPRYKELHGARVTLKLIEENDLPDVLNILQDPEVSKWWGDWDLERIKEHFLDPDLGIYVIRKVDSDQSTGEIIGSAQYYEEQSPDFRHAGMDVFLRASARGRGLGADTIRTICRHLFYDRGHHRIVVDPDARNETAIQAWRSIGFKKVGIMRQAQRGPDDLWHDCVMLEALKGEIT